MNTPEGWKLVPVEPTPEMQSAAERYAGYHNRVPFSAGYYRALLAAAPTPPEQPAAQRLPTQEEIDAGPHGGLGNVPEDYARAAAQPEYGSISERAQAGLEAGLWKPEPAEQPEPFKPETWPVDADGFVPDLCTECGTPVRYGSRHSACGAAAMARGKRPQQPAAEGYRWIQATFEEWSAVQALRRQPEPGGPVDRGPWNVTEAGNLQSDDFTHDVTLQISGDFENKAQRIAYADGLCNLLNSSIAAHDAARKRPEAEVAEIMEAVRLALSNKVSIHEVERLVRGPR